MFNYDDNFKKVRYMQLVWFDWAVGTWADWTGVTRRA